MTNEIKEAIPLSEKSYLSTLERLKQTMFMDPDGNNAEHLANFLILNATLEEKRIR